MALTVTLTDGGTETLTGIHERWVKATITPGNGSDYGTYSFWADSKYSSNYIQQDIYTQADSNIKSTPTFTITSTTTIVRYFWLTYAGETSYDIQLRNAYGTVLFTETYTKGMSGGGGSATTQLCWVKYHSNNEEGQTKTQSTEVAAGSTTGITVCRLSDTGFTTPRYKTFSHWNTQSNNHGTSYEPGSTIYVKANTMAELYAIWSTVQQTISITYHKNDGSGSTKKIDYTGDYGNVSITLSSPYDVFSTPSGKTFSCWNTSPDGFGKKYESGETTTDFNSNSNLYAIWTDNDAVTPSITSVSKTASTITINWTVNASYGTTYATLGESTSSNFSVSSSGQIYTCTFSRLSSNTSYIIYVYHKNGSSSKSSNTTVKTNIALFVWTDNDSTYIVAGQSPSNITATKWNALQAKISEVSAQIGAGTVGYDNASAGKPILANSESGADYGFNNVRNRIANLPSGNSGLPSTVSKGQKMLASYFIALKTAINNAINNANINY